MYLSSIMSVTNVRKMRFLDLHKYAGYYGLIAAPNFFMVSVISCLFEFMNF